MQPQDEPRWWYEGIDNRLPDGRYVPTEQQQGWLVANDLQVGWAKADGDCSFSATARTIGPSRVGEAMRRISGQGGVPVPDLAGQPVPGRDLRRFPGRAGE